MHTLLGTCPACNLPWPLHPRSLFTRPTKALDFAVIRGRCEVLGERAPQKICWLPLGSFSTAADYLAQYADISPSPGACPVCGSRLEPHGRFFRSLQLHSGEEIQIPLYRGLCKEDDCPIVTVTLYPAFVTPFGRAETRIRESCLRAHDEEHLSWERCGEQQGVSPDTARRWGRDFRPRVTLLTGVLLAVLFTFDSRFLLPPDPTPWPLLDQTLDLLGLDVGLPRLSVSRVLLPSTRAPPRWPVWT